MHVTYLYHSGFLLEWTNSYWIFDYYKGEIPALNIKKDIFVFCSHSHHDHFNPKIFSILKAYPKVTYLFAEEMKEVCSKIDTPEIYFLENNIDVTIKGLKIHTLKSTDMGCAFVIDYEGYTVYHAGDLHWWYWDGEDPDWNAQMTADYKKEIEYLKGKTLDFAFTPLDPRQGNEYALGMNYLLNIAQVKNVFPMHCWDDISIIDKYLQEYELPEGTKLFHLKEVYYENNIF